MKYIRPLFLLAVLFLSISTQLFASRIEMQEIEAWSNPDTLIIEGIVKRAHYEDNIAYYDISVEKVHKPDNMNKLRRITVKDFYYHSTAQISLEKDENVMLFAEKMDDGYYNSLKEIDLDTQYGREEYNGIKLFLNLMSIKDQDKKSKKCINLYNGSLPISKKKAILDVMWETRSSVYTDALVDISKNENNPELRSWAITILAYIDGNDRSKELVYLLDDPNFDVKRQLLILFGSKKTREAAPKIELILKDKLNNMPDWQANSLREIAKEALDKISGKNTSPYWVN